MRLSLVSLTVALVAVSYSWIAEANPALNNSVTGTVSTTAATQVASTQAVAGIQAGLETAKLTPSAHFSSVPETTVLDESRMPNGWLMAFVGVLLVGHQLRRKHRFLRPQRFSDL